jgi:hypothetical protein
MIDIDPITKIQRIALRVGAVLLLITLAIFAIKAYGADRYADGQAAERHAWEIKMTEEKARAAGIRRGIEAEIQHKEAALDELRENLTAAQRTAMEAASAADQEPVVDGTPTPNPRPRVVLPRSVVRAIGEVH